MYRECFYTKEIANIITGKQVTLNAKNIQQIVDEANFHGLIPIIYDTVSKEDVPKNRSSENRFLLDILKKYILENAIKGKYVTSEAYKVLKELNNRNIKYLVLKGFSLSHRVYRDISLRPSVDIDLLIESGDIEAAKSVFEQLGYYKKWEPKEVHYQFTYSKKLMTNIKCHWDIHKKISNDNYVADILRFEELYDSREEVYFGDAKFTTINVAYAFIHASIHFLRHTYRKDTVRLVWYYDLYLILEKMSKENYDLLLKLVYEKKIGKVIKVAVDSANEYFYSPKLLNLSKQLGIQKNSDNLLYILDEDSTTLERFMKQLKGCKTLRQRAALIFETLFPPKSSIIAKYGKVPSYLLLFFYLRRAISGFFKWLK